MLTLNISVNRPLHVTHNHTQSVPSKQPTARCPLQQCCRASAYRWFITNYRVCASCQRRVNTQFSEDDHCAIKLWYLFVQCRTGDMQKTRIAWFLGIFSWNLFCFLLNVWPVILLRMTFLNKLYISEYTHKWHHIPLLLHIAAALSFRPKVHVTTNTHHCTTHINYRRARTFRATPLGHLCAKSLSMWQSSRPIWRFYQVLRARTLSGLYRSLVREYTKLSFHRDEATAPNSIVDISFVGCCWVNAAYKAHTMHYDSVVHRTSAVYIHGCRKIRIIFHYPDRLSSQKVTLYLSVSFSSACVMARARRVRITTKIAPQAVAATTLNRGQITLCINFHRIFHANLGRIVISIYILGSPRGDRYRNGLRLKALFEMGCDLYLTQGITEFRSCLATSCYICDSLLLHWIWVNKN